MTLSIDDSIQKLKTEIISQDWNLPLKRIEQLEPAFSCLKQRFKTRKNVLAILTMGDNILQYVKKKGRAPSPDFVDFLKEAMAHVVNIYEDNKFDPESEEKIFKRMYSRFNSLKQQLDTSGNPAKVEANPPSVSLPPNKPAASPLSPAAPQAAAPESPRVQPPAHNPQTAGIPTQPAPPFRQGIKTSPASRQHSVRPQTGWAPAAGITVLRFRIGTMQLGIAQDNLAMIRPVSVKDRTRYLKANQVPLKDFTGFLQRLSSQFKGELATMKSSRLKRLALPLVTPKGIGLLSMPDEKADHLLVLTVNQRHGILLCSDISPDIGLLQGFQIGKNGDIAGLAFLDGEKTVPLLNTCSILEREGFLSLPS